MRIIKAGATSQSVYVEIFDSTSSTGGRKTGLAYNTASLTAYYVRNGGSATSITLATLAAANSAYSSGGFKEVDATNMPGVYRLDLPDAAVAASATSVVITLKGATGMVQVSVEIQLVAVDLQDAVRGGMTALPNASAEASGGLYTRGTGAGQINQDANGRIDANTKAWIGGAIPAVNVTGVPLVDAKYLLGTIFATPAVAGIPSVDTVYMSGDSTAADKLEAWMDGLLNNTAQAGAAGSITLNAGAVATDDYYKGVLILISGGTGVGQSRLITGYTGSSKVATVSPNWATNPDNTSTFILFPHGRADVWGLLGTILSTPATAGILDVNVLALSGDTVAADNAESFFDGTGYAGTGNTIPTVTSVTNRVTADSDRINGSATAAAQLAKSAPTIVSGTAITGTLSSTQATTDLTEATDNHYVGRTLIFTSGSLQNIAVLITAYNGTSKLLTYTATPTGESPSNADTFIIV